MKKMGTPPCFSTIITKGNVIFFLHASLDDKTIPKCTPKEAIFFLEEFTPTD